MLSSVMTAIKVPLPKEVVRHWANGYSSQVPISAKQLNLSQTFMFTLAHLNPLLQMNKSTLKSLLPTKAFEAEIWKSLVLHWFYPNNNITLLKSHVRGASFHLSLCKTSIPKEFGSLLNSSSLSGLQVKYCKLWQWGWILTILTNSCCHPSIV